MSVEVYRGLAGVAAASAGARGAAAAAAPADPARAAALAEALAALEAAVPAPLDLPAAARAIGGGGLYAAGGYYGDPLAPARALGGGRLAAVYLGDEPAPLAPAAAAARLGPRLAWPEGGPVRAARTADPPALHVATSAPGRWQTFLLPPGAGGADGAGSPASASDAGGLAVAATPPVGVGGGGGSARRGAAGETAVERWLAAGGRAAADVSRRARSADMVVATAPGLVYVEAKNYAGAVPGREVEKFRRDLAARAAAGGVLVSAASPVVGAGGRRLVLRLEAGPAGRCVPVAYVSRAAEAPGLVAAAVDLVEALAAAHPRAAARLALPSAAGPLEALGDGWARIRGEVRELAADFSARLGALGEAAAVAAWECRRTAAAARAAEAAGAGAGEAGEAAGGGGGPPGPGLPGAAPGLAGVLALFAGVGAEGRRLVAAAAGLIAAGDPPGAPAPWDLGAGRATHRPSGRALVCRRGRGAAPPRALLVVPLGRVPAGAVEALLRELPGAAEVRQGALEVALAGPAALAGLDML